MMPRSNLVQISRIESQRWFRDLTIVVILAVTILAATTLTYFAVRVAAGLIASGTGGVEIQTSTSLGRGSTDADLASLLHSSLVLLVPIAASVVGVRFAAGEMSSGALMTIAIAARRLRLLFAIRAALLVLTLIALAVLSALIVSVAAQVALSGAADLSHLSAWTYADRLLAGTVVQSTVFGLIAFSLSALTRRWVLILIGAIVYIVIVEPTVQGLVPVEMAWLPRSATSDLILPDPHWGPALPIIVGTAILALSAIVILRRDHAFR
jgi:hypothetical protein